MSTSVVDFSSLLMALKILETITPGLTCGQGSNYSSKKEYRKNRSASL